VVGAGLLAAGVAVVVQRHARYQQTQAAEFAARTADLERAARTAAVNCYAALAAGLQPFNAITANKHFPCDALPLTRSRQRDGDPYWTVIALKGVPYAEAALHGLSIACQERGTGRSGDSARLVRSSGGFDLLAVVEGVAANKDEKLPTINCQVRDHSGALIRTLTVVKKLDRRKRFTVK
jgi:hypothetical protein